MSSGVILGISLAALLFIWGLADYLVGLNGGETLSKWLIDKKKKYPWLRFLLLSIIVLFSGWLVIHLELI